MARERMPGFIPAKALPHETAPLAPAVQPLEQQLPDRMVKAPQGGAVVGDAKVVEMPTHLARDRLPEVGHHALVPQYGLAATSWKNLTILIRSS
jgi:hypothetical protein